MRVKLKALNTVMLIWILIVVFYGIYYVFFKESLMTMADLILIVVSTIIISMATADIYNNGIKADNLFFVIFFCVVLLNQFDISKYQKPKSNLDLYYLIIGPVLFGIILHFFEMRQKLFIKVSNRKEYEYFGWKYIALFYLTIMVYIFSRTGIRFLSGALDSRDEMDYVIPGLSGMAYILAYVLLMQIPKMKKKERIAIIILLLLIQGILGGHRGEMMRIFIYALIVYLCSKENTLINSRNIRKIALILIVLAFFFGLAGNYRQHVIYKSAKASTSFSITNKIQSRVDSSTLNWIYAYSAINIDVLKEAITQIPSNKPPQIELILLPLERIIHGSGSVSEYYNRLNFGHFAGINAATFLKPYIYDMGKMYFIEMILAAIIYGMLLRCSKRNSEGAYYFILLLIALTIFGDYMFSPNRFLAVIANMIFDVIERKMGLFHEKRFFDTLRIKKQRA